MLRNLIHFLDDNLAVWENESLVTGQIDEFKQKKLILDDLISEEEQLSMPFSGIRDEEREQFNTIFAQLSGILHSICSENGRTDTAYFVGLSPRELMRDSLEKTVAKADNIIKLAEEFSDELAAHASAQTILSSAQALFDKFKRSMILPTERRKRRKKALTHIDQLQEEILKFLAERLDMNMRIFSHSEVRFYEEYIEFRNVPSITGGRKKADDSSDEEVVVDDESNNSDPPVEDTELDDGDMDDTSSGDDSEGDSYDAAA